MEIWVWLAGVVLGLQCGLGNSHQSKYGMGYQGRYTGKCRGDGMYYRDSYSFVTCTHSIGYLQPCPPGTRNKNYQYYSPESAHFCTENLVNIGYTVYNQHPPHGLHSLRKKKRKSYYERMRRKARIGYAHRRMAGARHHRGRAGGGYERPGERMYSPPADGGHRGAHHHHHPGAAPRHYHTGPEVHGPYRDQAKDTLASLVEEAEDGGNEISSELQHPLLTFHQKSKQRRKRPSIEARHIKLVKPTQAYHAHEDRSPLEFPGEERSLQLMADREEDDLMTSSPERRHGNDNHRFPGPAKANLRLDPSLLRLLPPKERSWLHQRKRRANQEDSIYARPESPASQHIAAVKRKVFETYARAQRRGFRTPVYDQYSLGRGPSRGRRAVADNFQNEVLEAPQEDEGKSLGELLLTVVGMGDKILSYKEAPAYRNAKRGKHTKYYWEAKKYHPH